MPKFVYGIFYYSGSKDEEWKAKRKAWAEKLKIEDRDYSSFLCTSDDYVAMAIELGTDAVRIEEDQKSAAYINSKLEDIVKVPMEKPFPEDYYNSKVEVHVPGQALMLMNEILLLEDDCSDYLQSKLDGGWRIIAACPQPDQRRPDYILGRFNPLHQDNIESRAQRK